MNLEITTRQEWHRQILQMLEDAEEPISPQRDNIKPDYLHDLEAMGCISKSKMSFGARPRNVYTITARGEMYLEAFQKNELANVKVWARNPGIARLYLVWGNKRDAAIHLAHIVSRRNGEFDGTYDALLDDMCNDDNAYVRTYGILAKQRGKLNYLPADDDGTGLRKSENETTEIGLHITPGVLPALQRLSDYAETHGLSAWMHSPAASAAVVCEMAIIIAAEMIDELDPDAVDELTGEPV